MTRAEIVLFLARRFTFVREVGGPNQGVWVSTIQHVTGNQPPDSWCASFVSLILGMTFNGVSPLPRTASTRVMLDDAKAKGMVVTTPEVADLYFYVHADGTPHHVGFITQLSPLMGIAGNTSADGTSSNGDRVAEHTIGGNIVYARYL